MGTTFAFAGRDVGPVVPGVADAVAHMIGEDQGTGKGWQTPWRTPWATEHPTGRLPEAWARIRVRVFSPKKGVAMSQPIDFAGVVDAGARWARL